MTTSYLFPASGGSIFRRSFRENQRDIFYLRHPVFVALMLLMVLSLFSSPAMAQSFEFFDDIGGKAKDLFCAYLDSPIVPVILGIALAAVLAMMVFGDENSGSSKLLKGVLLGVVIMFIPKIITWLGWQGFESACLTNFRV